MSGIFPVARSEKVLLACALVAGVVIAMAGTAFLGGFKGKGDWVDQKWQGSSKEWKRGYRDYHDKDVGNDYRDARRELAHELWRILDYKDVSSDDYKADIEREIAKLHLIPEELKVKIQVAAAAKEKLEQRTTNAVEYWDGWKLAECEVDRAARMEELREEEKAREEGRHLKKVLEYAR